MECANNNSIIITLAILMHGKVINLDITNNIFDNVRLFSKAGDLQDVVSSRLGELVILRKVNEMFQTDLTEPTINIIQKYVEYSHPKYKSLLEGEEKMNRENVCRLFENITIDKTFSKTVIRPSGFINRILCLVDYIFPEFQGIFLVSIHEKVDDYNFKLIYPPHNEHKNLNLLELDNLALFASLFNKQLPNLHQYSSEFPSYIEYEEQEQNINNDPSLLLEEKTEKIDILRGQLYNLLTQWNLTIMNNSIEAIRMSKLVEIIKQIVGPQCNINLLDYSCNSLTKYIPKEQRKYIKYFEPLDVESELDVSYGGKTNKKARTKKRKLKRHNKSKKL
jgi:hypothetical protein